MSPIHLLKGILSESTGAEARLLADVGMSEARLAEIFNGLM